MDSLMPFLAFLLTFAYMLLVWWPLQGTWLRPYVYVWWGLVGGAFLIVMTCAAFTILLNLFWLLPAGMGLVALLFALQGLTDAQAYSRLVTYPLTWNEESRYDD